MKTTQKAAIGLQGYVKVEVLSHTGRVVLSRDWQPNLILDQGLNAMADVSIADLFKYAAAGTGTTLPTKETVPIANTYTANGTGNLARVGGTTRDFTAGDLNKLVQRTDGGKEECIIIAIGSTTSVSVRAVGASGTLASYTGKNIIIYSVQQVGLQAESGPRTNIYSQVSGHNKSTDSLPNGRRTLQRTFVFPALTEAKESLGISYTATSATHVHRNGTGRVFTANDVGKFLHYPDAAYHNGGLITNFIDGDNVTVATIPGWVAGQSGAIDLYAGAKYGEVGFSHLSAAGNNLNIRVRLEDGAGASDPVPINGPRPGMPSQQLRVTYKLEIDVLPITKITGNTNITDPGNSMSSLGQGGEYTIEQLALSSINNDGSSNLNLSSLEPATPAAAGLSTVTAGLSPIGGTPTSPDRGNGASSTPLIAQPYDLHDFERIYEGTFGVNEGVGTGWMALGIFDGDNSSFPFVFRWDNKQKKTAEQSLIVRFIKKWNRSLA